MSLAVEGTGATCVECGVFDFLPTTCPHCRGIFCRDHAYRHHRHAVSAEQGTTSTATVPASHAEEEVEWCAPPPLSHSHGPEAEDAGENATTTTTTTVAPASAGAQCFLCPSPWCVLTPCPRCGHNFCAAHRFHGHEEDDEAGTHADGSEAVRRQRRFTPRVLPEGLRRHRAQAPVNTLTTACAPYGKTSPLTLAPPGYRSRMMELVAILCSWQSTGPSEGEAKVEHDGWQVAVCSLSVAVEAAAGQMLQRLLCMLGLASDRGAGGMDSPELQSLCGRSRLYSISGSMQDAGRGTDGVGEKSVKSVAVHLRSLPLSSVTKEELRPGECFVVRVGGEIDSGEAASPGPLEAFLSRVLFPLPQADDTSSSSPSVNAYEYLVMDDRVRAVVTRLRLRAAAGNRSEEPNCATATATATREAKPDVAVGSVSMPPPPPQVATAQPSASAPAVAETGAAVWPFHLPPPLTTMKFANSKANPAGAKHLASGSSGGRVLVAVFTQDYDVTRTVPIPPFVLALGRDWPVGKVVERIKEEAFALLTDPRDRDAARLPASPQRLFPTFDVFLLGSSTAPPNSVATAAAPLLQRATATSPLLKDGDVLFHGRAAACAPGSGLAREVERMQSLTGKELAAQRFELMRRCTVM